MRQIVGDVDLRNAMLAVDELPGYLQKVIGRGWIRDSNGALLLAALNEAAHPAVGKFINLTFYEASVNHLHIPDVSSHAEPNGGQLQSVRVAYSFCYHLIRQEKDATLSDRNLIAVVASGDVGDGTSVRIYIKRPNEYWLDGHLENYADEAVLTFGSADVL